MPRPRSLVSKFSIAVAAYLFLVVPAAVYYYFYTESQREYFSARNFRQLWIMSEQLRFTLANYRNVLDNASTEDDPRTYLNRFVKELAWVDSDEPVAAGYRLKPVIGHGDWAIRLSYSQGGKSIVADRDVRDMIERFPGAAVFDHILLASDPNTVIYQSGASGLRFTSLDGLGVTPPGKGGESAPGLRGASRLYSRVIISGEPYEVYLQPMPVGGAGAQNAPAEWTLCALVRSRTFLSESLAISYDLIIWFLSVCVLILLTLPLLRFRNLSGWESIGLRDIVGIFVCGCCFAGIFVLFCLHLFHYEVVEPRTLTLEPLARDISRQFTSELQRISRQLDGYCNSAPLWKQISAHATVRRVPGWKPNARPAEDLQETSTLITPGIYPWLKFVVWADEAGWQWIKWDLRASVTPFINISERIAGLKTSSAWELPPSPEGRLLPFRLELVFSQNTGEYIANYVVRTRDCIAEPRNAADLEIYHNDPLITRGYAYIATELKSGVNPVLPPDSGFAIIDETGKTLVHSEAIRNQWENFLVETDDDDRLRAAVSSRGVTSLKIRYKGTDHDAFVMPLQGIPFSLVVFRDNGNLNTMHLETQTLAAFLLLSFLGVLTLVGILVLRSTSGPYPASWIWPDAGLCAVYRGNTLLNGLLAALMAFWTIFARSAELYFAVIVIGSVAFVLNLMALILRRRFAFRGWLPLLIVAVVLILSPLCFTNPGHALLLPAGLSGVMLIGSLRPLHKWIEASGRLECSHAYAFAATTLLCLLGVLPAVACFRIAHDLEMELLVRSAQIEISKKVASRIGDAARRFDDNQAARHLARSQGREVALLRAFRPEDALEGSYIRSFFNTTAQLPPSGTPGFTHQPGSDFQRFLAGIRIAYNRGVSHTSGIPLSRTSTNWSWADGPWPVLKYWNQSDSGSSGRYSPIVSTDFRPLVHVTSGTALLNAWPVLAFWTLVSALAFLLVYFSLRYFARVLAMPELTVVARPSEMMAAAAAHGSSSGSDSVDDWTGARFKFGMALADNPERDRLLAHLERECGQTGVLRQIGAALARDLQFTPANQTELQYAISAACESHYEALWKRLSSQQRFALYRLATDGMVNPRNKAVLYSLLKTGLVVSTPRYEIFNDTFRLFILSHIDPSEALQWTTEKENRRMPSTRILVVLLVALIIGFLFFTQPDLLQTSVGFFTALAAAIGALMKLLPSQGQSPPADK